MPDPCDPQKNLEDFHNVAAGANWTYIEATASIGAPTGATQLEVIFMSEIYNTNDYDDMSLVVFGFVHAIDPANGTSVDPDSVDTLVWERDAIMPGDLEPEVEVWWGDSDANDVTFWSNSEKIMDQNDFDSLVLTGISTAEGSILPLDPDRDYYWALKHEDPESGTGLPLLEGPVWSFDTSNERPVVDAGSDYDKWLSAAVPGPAEVTVSLDGGYTDDLLGGGPWTTTWSKVSGSGSVVFSPSGDGGTTGNAEDVTATFSTADNYELKLVVNDGSLDGEDSIFVRVFANDDDRLRVHYKLDETTGLIADDSDDSDPCDIHDGTVIGDPNWQPEAGQVDGALEFYGEGDYIELDDTGDANDLDGDGFSWENTDLIDGMTVAAWIQLPTGWTSSWQCVVAQHSDSWELLRYENNDTIGFGIKGDVGTAFSTSQSVSDGKWHHVVGVFDRNTVKLYIDGTLETTNPAGATQIPMGSGKIRIGSTNPWDIAYTGLIDEVRIYDAAVPYIADNPGAPGILDIFRDDGGHGCGGVYAVTDFDQDCYTGLSDFAIFAAEWMDCFDVVNPICD
jgi:hypothetical protein